MNIHRYITIFFLFIGFNTIALTFDISPNSDIVGNIKSTEIEPNQTFYHIAREHGLGTLEVIEANPHLNPNKLKAGQKVLIPSAFILPPGERNGIVLNLAELRIYFYHPDGKQVSTFPVGIGRLGWRTPVGEAKVVRKRENPTWTPPASIRRAAARKGKTLPAVMPAGPNNPLGDYAMNLSWPRYLIHGTNKPNSVGMRSSSGCIRLYPEHIEELYKLVPLKTKVRVIHEPYKIGQEGNRVFMEAHQPLAEKYYSLEDDEEDIIREAVENFTEFNRRHLNWDKVEREVKETFGYPVSIGIK